MLNEECRLIATPCFKENYENKYYFVTKYGIILFNDYELLIIVIMGRPSKGKL
jgi:hypothetical protein